MATTVVVELTSDEERVLNAFRKIVSEDAKLRAAASKTTDEIKARYKELADDMIRGGKEGTEGINKLISSLSKGNKEARELGKALGEEVRMAALEAKGGVEGVLAKILEMKPELQETADVWRKDVAEAAKYSEKQYEEALNKLRELGPVGTKVAKHVKGELVGAGTLMKKTFDDAIEELRRVDPEMAKQAVAYKAHLDKMDEKNNNVWRKMSADAVRQIASIITAYVGIQEAIQAVTNQFREQRQIYDEISRSQTDLARTQFEAQKNLADLPKSTQDDLLLNLVPTVAKQTSFDRIDILTQTVGDIYSAGATVEQLKQVLPVAAALTAMTPENAPKTAGALVDIARATGNINAAENASQLFLVGSRARVTEPDKLFRNVAPVALAGSVVSGEQGAIQGQALFAALTRAGADIQGDAGATASIQFIARVDEFFKNLGKDATKAKEELDKLEKADPLSAVQRAALEDLSNREASKVHTETSIRTIQSRLDEIERDEDQRGRFMSAPEKDAYKIEKRDLRRELARLSQLEFTDMDQARLNDLRSQITDEDRKFQEQKAKLEARIAAANIQGFQGDIPDNLLDQLKVLQTDKALRDAFESDKFGEQRFRPGYEQLLTGGQAFKDFVDTLNLMQERKGKTDLFEARAQDSRFGNPVQEAAFFTRQERTADALRAFGDVRAGIIGDYRTSTEEVLKATRSEGFVAGTLQYLSEYGGMLGGAARPGQAGAPEMLSAFREIIGRRAYIAKDGITEDELPKFQRLTSAAETMIDRFASTGIIRTDMNLEAVARRTAEFQGSNVMFPEATGINKDLVERLNLTLQQSLEIQRRILAEQEKQTTASAATARNTVPQPPSTSNAMGGIPGP